MNMEEVSTRYAGSPFKLDSYHIPPPDMDGEPIAHMYRVSPGSLVSASGETVEKARYLKEKFTWNYKYLDAEVAEAIINYITSEEIRQGKSRHNITSYSMSKGFITTLCHLQGERDVTFRTPLRGTSRAGTLVSLSLRWTQIKGVRLG